VIGKMVPVYVIAVEKQEPYRCGVWQVGSDFWHADDADQP